MPVLRLGHVSDDEGRMGRMRTRGLVLMVLDVLLWPSQSEAKPRAKMNSVQRKKWCQVRSNGFPLFLSLKLDVSSKMTCQLGASHMHGMLSGEIQSSLKRYPEKYTQSDDLMTCDESVCTYQYFTYCIYIYISYMRFATWDLQRSRRWNMIHWLHEVMGLHDLLFFENEDCFNQSMKTLWRFGWRWL